MYALKFVINVKYLQLTEKNPRHVKNFGIWIKYNSRSGTHNMYREYRDVTLNGAVTTLCKNAMLLCLVLIV